jgi:hypothetical protein
MIENSLEYKGMFCAPKKVHSDLRLSRRGVRSLKDINQCFRGAYCLYNLMVETVSSSETSVNFHQTTRCDFLEDSHLLEPSHPNGDVLSKHNQVKPNRLTYQLSI